MNIFISIFYALVSSLENKQQRIHTIPYPINFIIGIFVSSQHKLGTAERKFNVSNIN